MKLWTCHLALSGSSLFSQVQAEDPHAATQAFLLTEKPFQKILGPASGWPENPDDLDLEIFPNEEFRGFFHCAASFGGNTASIDLIETVDQEWPPEGFDEFDV